MAHMRNDAGQLTTKAIPIHSGGGGGGGCKITVNADTTHNVTSTDTGLGAALEPELRIELLSASGYALHGWDHASALPITKTSGIAIPTRWGSTAPHNTPPSGPPLKTECHAGPGGKHCVAPWRLRLCETNSDCASVPGVGPVTCGGKRLVCTKSNVDHHLKFCWSTAYEAPLCVMNATAPPGPPPPPPHPPSSKLPSDVSEVMVRAHLSGGAKLYAINVVCE